MSIQRHHTPANRTSSSQPAVSASVTTPPAPISTMPPEPTRSTRLKARLHHNLHTLNPLRHRSRSPTSRYPPERRPPPRSSLLTLPFELREQIWKLVLTRPAAAKPAHFHLYDKIYDSCTYDAHTATTTPAAHPHAAALLRTCQAVYLETVQLLFDVWKFELVLLPGFVRPSKILTQDYPGGRELEENVEQRNCLGEVAACARLLRRMRHVTLVVQPGGYPSVPGYVKRIETFVKAIEYGAHLGYLCVKFNTFFEASFLSATFSAFIDALKPLGRRPLDRRREVVIQRGEFAVLVGTHHDVLIQNAIAGLRHALAVTDENFVVWRQELEGMHVCMHRGALAGFWAQRPKATKSEMRQGTWALVILASVGVVLLPLTVGLLGATFVERKVRKGESWRVFWGDLSG